MSGLGQCFKSLHLITHDTSRHTVHLLYPPHKPSRALEKVVRDGTLRRGVSNQFKWGVASPGFGVWPGCCNTPTLLGHVGILPRPSLFAGEIAESELYLVHDDQPRGMQKVCVPLSYAESPYNVDLRPTGRFVLSAVSKSSAPMTYWQR
jgi:hypothetical protein